jgi:hypothetical protein
MEAAAPRVEEEEEEEAKEEGATNACGREKDVESVRGRGVQRVVQVRHRRHAGVKCQGGLSRDEYWEAIQWGEEGRRGDEPSPSNGG